MTPFQIGLWRGCGWGLFAAIIALAVVHGASEESFPLKVITAIALVAFAIDVAVTLYRNRDAALQSSVAPEGKRE